MVPAVDTRLGYVCCSLKSMARPQMRGLGALIIPGIAEAAAGITVPLGIGPATASTGPSWWESALQTVGKVAEYGAEIGKVAVPAYLSLRQMQEQTKLLRSQMRATGTVDPQLLQEAGQTLSVIPGVGQQLQEMQNELLKLQLANQSVSRGTTAFPLGVPATPTITGTPGGPAGAATPQTATASTMEKALPWVAGGAAVLVVLLVVMMKK